MQRLRFTLVVVLLCLPTYLAKADEVATVGPTIISAGSSGGDEIATRPRISRNQDRPHVMVCPPNCPIYQPPEGSGSGGTSCYQDVQCSIKNDGNCVDHTGSTCKTSNSGVGCEAC